MGKRSKKHNYAKGWETRRRNAALKARQTPNIETAQAALNDMRRSQLQALAGQQTPPPAAPLSELDIKTRAIMVAARKADGEKAVRDALERHGLQAAFEGREQERKTYREILDERDEQHAIVIISGFMASIESISALNGGGLPPAVVMTGISAARVYDALKKFGYTRDGFKTQREPLMGKSHADLVRGQGQR